MNMIWAFIFGVLLAAGIAALVEFRHRISPKAVLMGSLPLLLLSLWAYHSGAAVSGVEAAAANANEDTYDLSGKLFTVEGKPVDVSELEGKVIFLNFWATWCGPCRAEMPSMAKLYDQLGEQGLTMVAITDEDPEPVRQYLEDSPFPFTVLLDRDAVLFERLRVRGLPTTFVFNDKDELLLQHVGGYDWSTPDLVAQFRNILKDSEE